MAPYGHLGAAHSLALFQPLTWEEESLHLSPGCHLMCRWMLGAGRESLAMRRYSRWPTVRYWNVGPFPQLGSSRDAARQTVRISANERKAAGDNTVQHQPGIDVMLSE